MVLMEYLLAYSLAVVFTAVVVGGGLGSKGRKKGLYAGGCLRGWGENVNDLSSCHILYIFVAASCRGRRI